MKNRHSFKVLAILATLGLLSAACRAPETDQPQGESPTSGADAVTLAPASEAAARSLTIVTLSGTVLARSDLESEFSPASQGQTLEVGHQLLTAVDGEALLRLDDDMFLVVSANSVFSVTALEGTTERPQTRLFLNVGQLFSFRADSLPAGATYEIETPNGVAAIRGSWMGLSVYPDIINLNPDLLNLLLMPDILNVLPDILNSVNGLTIADCFEGSCSLSRGIDTSPLGGGQAAAVFEPNALVALLGGSGSNSSGGQVAAVFEPNAADAIFGPDDAFAVFGLYGALGIFEPDSAFAVFELGGYTGGDGDDEILRLISGPTLFGRAVTGGGFHWCVECGAGDETEFGLPGQDGYTGSTLFGPQVIGDAPQVKLEAIMLRYDLFGFLGLDTSPVVDTPPVVDAPPAQVLCGNGLLDGNEECDVPQIPVGCFQTNVTISTQDQLACDQLLQQCGSGQTCSDSCACQSFASVCGDGLVTGSEQCEENAQCGAGQYCVDPGQGGLSCSCLLACGDGFLASNEVCDSNANCNPGYECSGVCSACTPICGDGVCLDTETVDTCFNDCYVAPPPTCGNGVLDAGEVCDGSATPTGCVSVVAVLTCNADCTACT